MFGSRGSVDKRVDSILSSIRDSKERQGKGFQIAKLYYDAKDYDTAKKYLAGYLSGRDGYAPAHKLMGQICEALGQHEQAVTSYKRSLEIDDKQKDVLAKICENFCHIESDPDRAMYWADRLEKVTPSHQAVFTLKEKALSRMCSDLTGSRAAELEDLLAAQLASNPRLAGARVKLMDLYVRTQRVNEAFTHVTQVEKRLPHLDSIEWYQCVQQVLEAYRAESGSHVNGVYHVTLLHVLDRLVTLQLRHATPSHVITTLHTFDETIKRCGENTSLDGAAWRVVLQHMRAQLFYHCGTLLLLRAKQDEVAWKDVSELVAACYLCSLSFKPPNIHLPWYTGLSEGERGLYTHMYSVTCARLSETAHMVRRLCNGAVDQGTLNKVAAKLGSVQAREALHGKVFTRAQMKQTRADSYLVQQTVSATHTPELPSRDVMRECEQVSTQVTPDDLNPIVWTALQYYDVTHPLLPKPMQLEMFEGLQHGVLNLSPASTESLCLLDIEIFVSLCVREAAIRRNDVTVSRLSEPGEPDMLPLSLSEQLVTQEQLQWWQAAYQLHYDVTREQLGALRLRLQHGLETVRMLTPGALHVSHMLHVARTCQTRAERARAQASHVLQLANEVASLQVRAHAYWKATVDAIENRLRGQNPRPPKQRLFDYSVPEPSDEELIGYLEEGRYYVALVARQDGQSEEALKLLEKVSTAESAHEQAMEGRYYVALVARQDGQSEEALKLLEKVNTADSVHEQTMIYACLGEEADDVTAQEALYTQARDKLYTCLDRIRGDHNHKLNSRLADDIEEMESRLQAISEGVPRDDAPHITLDDVDAMATSESGDHHMMGPSNQQQPGANNGTLGASKSFLTRPPFVASTPRRSLNTSLTVNTSHGNMSRSGGGSPRARPSPERLDAQIRAMSYGQDNTIRTLVDELKEQRKIIQTLTDKHESERSRWDEEKERLNHSLYEAQRQRDNNRVDEDRQRMDAERRVLDEETRRRHDDQVTRLQLERERMDQWLTEEKRRLDEDRRKQDEDQRRRQEEFDRRMQDERDRMEQRSAKEREWMDEFRREQAVWREEKSRESAQLKAELERLRTLLISAQGPGGNLGGLAGMPGAPGMTPGMHPPPRMPGPPPPGMAPPDLYAQHFRGYPGYDVMTGYPGFPGAGAAYAAPGAYGTPGGMATTGLHGYTYPDYSAEQQVAGGGVTRRTQRAGPSQSLAEEYYYEESDSEDQANSLYPGQTQPAVQTVVPELPNPNPAGTLPMPGPGFFSSPVTKPTLGSMAGDVGLANLLSSPSISSQAQGASLYQGSTQQTVPASVVLPPGTSVNQVDISMATRSQEQSLETTGVVTSTGAIAGASTTPNKPVNSPIRSPRKTSEGDELYVHDSSYTEPHFEPLVSLPEVETQTGEEGQDTLIEARAKLYRFIDNQWKERGLGQIKLLKNPTTGAVRVLMRRERVHKVCANHFIKSDMQIEPRSDDKTGKIMTWRALDHTEEEARLEQFCCRYKTAEDAEEFRKHFTEAVASAQSADDKAVETLESSEASRKATTSLATSTTTTSSITTNSTTTTSLATSSVATSESAIPTTVKAVSKDSPLDLSSNQTPDSTTDIQAPVSKETTATTTSSSGFGSTTSAFGSPASFGALSGANTSGSSLFGLNKPVFGSGAANSGGSVFGTVATPGSQGPSVFGSKSATGGNSAAPPEGGAVFGGFTFSHKPEVKKTEEPKVDTKQQEVPESKKEEKKENPFSGFSFAASANQSAGGLFGTAAPEIGFGDLAKSGSGFSAPSSTTGAGFEGSGTPVFGAKASPTKASGEGGGADTEYEPEVDFKPIVSLPEVETKTGEEDEEKLFSHRAKLYRFDPEAKQWKERGVGDIKILKNQNTGKCRIIMRRDQVLKLCANHSITAKMSIAPLSTGDKTYKWACQDFSEQELKSELFAAKFKHQEKADEFRDVFASCVKSCQAPAESTVTEDKPSSENSEDETSSTTSSSESTTPDSTTEPPKMSLADQFKAKAGEWDCTVCYVRNKGDVIQCAACESAKPGCEAEVQKQKAEQASKTSAAASAFKFGMPSGSVKTDSPAPSTFSFGNSTPFGTPTTTKPTETAEKSVGQAKPTSLADQFKAKEGEWDCTVCYVRNNCDVIQCAACESAKPGCEAEVEKQKKASQSQTSAAASAFKFGMPSGTTETPDNKSETSTFSFGSSTFGSTTNGAPTFGSSATFGTPNTNTATSFSFGNSGSVFGSAGKSVNTSFGQTNDAAKTTDVDDKSVSPNRGFSFNKPRAGEAVKEDVTAKDDKQIGGSSFGTKEFTFSGLSPQKDVAKSTAPRSPIKSPGGEEGYYEGDDGDHIHFEPILELPTHYEHKTGEEDEETIYEHRAKLFRFVSGEWRERGLGDVRLLKHKHTAKVRLVMRREQTLRLCLNHYVTDTMTLKPMTGSKGKALTWFADDYSEEEMTHENFAAKFKTAEIASHFESIINLVKVGKAIPKELQQAPEPTPPKTPDVTHTTPMKSPVKPDVTSQGDNQSATPATFSFQALTSETTTPSKTPSFSSFKFGTPTFGAGVFTPPSKPAVFGTPSATFGSGAKSAFSFGTPTKSDVVTTSQSDQGACQGSSALLSLLSDTATQGQGQVASDVTSTQNVMTSSSQEPSLLRSLLADENSALGSTGFSALRSAMDDSVPTEDNDDVIITHVRTPTSEQRARAEKYQLPPCFFMYEDDDAPRCSGCRGCDPDSFDFSCIGPAAETKDEDEVIFLYEETGNAAQKARAEKYMLPHYFYANSSLKESEYANEAQQYANEACEYANDYDEDEERFVFNIEEETSKGEVSEDLKEKIRDFINADTAQVTGDRGNVHYSQELDASQQEDVIKPESAQVTGDRGNMAYSKQLDQAAEGSPSSGGLFQSPVNALGFGDLAKKSPKSNDGFAFGQKSETTPFTWKGAGSSIFGGGMPSADSGEASGDHGDVEQGPDVHFEPIVSLPEIEVVTGEEDEQVLFCERAKVYRFVDGAWKERGVGEVKILQNKSSGKCRVLQRREKILKISCNHAITPDMTLKPMQSSDTTWCYTAMDCADEEPKTEQLAIKFKNKDLASQFKQIFESCQQDTVSQPSAEPTSTDNNKKSVEQSDVTQDSEEQQVSSTTSETEASRSHDEEEEVEDELMTVFNKRVTMNIMNEQGATETTAQGELKVNYDDDVIGYRIIMENDSQERICSHIICRKYSLQKNHKKRFVEWTAKDFVTDEPQRRTFHVVFSSVPALEEFMNVFKQGVDLAIESEIDEMADKPQGTLLYEN